MKKSISVCVIFLIVPMLVFLIINSMISENHIVSSALSQYETQKELAQKNNLIIGTSKIARNKIEAAIGSKKFFIKELKNKHQLVISFKGKEGECQNLIVKHEALIKNILNKSSIIPPLIVVHGNLLKPDSEKLQRQFKIYINFQLYEYNSKSETLEPCKNEYLVFLN